MNKARPFENKWNLFLDDLRLPTFVDPKGRSVWYIARSSEHAKQMVLSYGMPYYISFDHDLADVHYEHVPEINYDKYQEKTGYHCAKWLIEYCLDNNLNIPRKIIIHSMNRMGAQNIKSLFDTYNKLYPNGTN